MSPSLAYLDSVFDERQRTPIKYLSDVYCGYSIGDSECITCPTIPVCPKQGETKKRSRGL